MAVEGLGSSSDGIAFLVSAGVMYEIIAAACSSPQTTELNACARAGTLMKWVHLGIAQGILFVGAAVRIDLGGLRGRACGRDDLVHHPGRDEERNPVRPAAHPLDGH